MRKTVLAVVLPSIILGASMSQAASVKDFKSFEKNYLKAVNTVAGKYSQFSAGEAKYSAKFEQANEKITLKDGFTFSQNNNGVIVKYEVNTVSDVDLSQYNPKDGKAVITGESTGDINVTVPQADASIVLKDIFSKAKYSLVFDEKANTFVGKMAIANNAAPLLFAGTQVAEVTFTDINNDAVIGFNNDYTVLASIKSDTTGKGVAFKLMGDITKEVDMSGDFASFTSSTNYVTAPFKVGAVATMKSADIKVNAIKDKESFVIAVKDADVKYNLEDVKGLISGNIAYKLGGFSLTKDQLPTFDFGSFALTMDAKGIKNIKDWQSFVQKLTEIQAKTQDFNELSEKEVKEIQAMFASLLTKDSRVELFIENKISDVDLAKLSVTFQPTEAFVKLVQKGPEAYKEAMTSKTPDVLINEFIQELTLSTAITENYMITQYKNALTLNGKDTSKVESEIKGGLQMFMMMAAMQAGPLGVTPAKLENGRVSIDIAFKDGKWDINGKKLTTAEIFAAFQ